MTRKAKKGWQIFTAGPCKYGVQVDGVPVLYVNDKMIAKAKGETAKKRDAVLRDFAASLSAHQAMRNAVFMTFLALAQNKVAAKQFRKELKMLESAMDKSAGFA